MKYAWDIKMTQLSSVIVGELSFTVVTLLT
uniref:Uncharacterized protein n=1 Tax=Anguilla anguilla TaxID=7936 RepID=A0A0E9XX54_ANGAN